MKSLRAYIKSTKNNKNMKNKKIKTKIRKVAFEKQIRLKIPFGISIFNNKIFI